MLVCVRWIQPDEDGRLVMWFHQIDATGAVVGGLHGQTSPLCRIELARDEDGLIRHDDLPDQAGVRIVTERASVYVAVMNRHDASQLAIRLYRGSRPAGQDPDQAQAEAALRSLERQGQEARNRLHQ